MTLVNLEGMIKMMKFLKFNHISNQLLLKKSLLFMLHYVNCKRFIIAHQHTSLRLKAYNLKGGCLKQTQEVKKKKL